jgi:hypothetical protein
LYLIDLNSGGIVYGKPVTTVSNSEAPIQARLAEPAVEFPWKRLLLWAVLALSVCLLAWMAYRLSKEIGGRIPG